MNIKNIGNALNELGELDEDIEEETIDDFDEKVKMIKPYDPTKIRVDPKTFSLRNVLDMIDDEDIDLAPDFQRMQVWSIKQKSRLIESILLRIPLPAFYFSSNTQGFMQVVDGVQRLSTIHDFVRKNAFKLQNLEYLDEDLAGLNFEDIQGTIWAKRINTTQIIVNVIDPSTPQAVKFDIFKRINTGGTPLNSQEIRHCMSGKKTRSLLKDMTLLDSFKKATGGKIVGNLRMADKELVLRWVAFTLLRSASSVNNNVVYGTLEDLMNSTCDQIDQSPKISSKDLLIKFDKAMQLSFKIFGDKAFRKMDDKEKKAPLNRALFEAWSVPLGQLPGKPEDIEFDTKNIVQQFKKLCTKDAFFISSISAGTGDPKKVAYRFEQVKKIIDDNAL